MARPTLMDEMRHGTANKGLSVQFWSVFGVFLTIVEFYNYNNFKAITTIGPVEMEKLPSSRLIKEGT